MQIAGKGNYTFTGRYEEIIEPEQIVHTETYREKFGYTLVPKRIKAFAEPANRTGERLRMEAGDSS